MKGYIGTHYVVWCGKCIQENIPKVPRPIETARKKG